MTADSVSGVTRATTTEARVSPISTPPGEGPILPERASVHSEAMEIARDIGQVAGAADRLIQFDIDSETERVVVRLVDRKSGDLIRQVPPDQVLAIIASINRLLGLFLDERA